MKPFVTIIIIFYIMYIGVCYTWLMAPLLRSLVAFKPSSNTVTHPQQTNSSKTYIQLVPLRLAMFVDIYTSVDNMWSYYATYTYI